LKLLAQNGYGVRNVAVQIIGNRPKVAPMRKAVEAALTEIVGAPVTLGATTTDGLGFLGNDEGVAAVVADYISIHVIDRGCEKEQTDNRPAIVRPFFLRCV
jgi:2-C-methyl-D-erythritol 2,4-cyclodiphosphate synthase